jgi:Asp-tRNA(Asn)/Glu-tRNA(Gln) amidotransferase A subunit family amidase
MKLSKDVITTAKLLMGIDYSESEWLQLVNDLEAQVLNAELRRKLKFPNSLAPSLRFDPRPIGFKEPKTIKGLKFLDKPTAEKPKDKKELAFSSVKVLGNWIVQKKITSLELTKIYLDRIDAFDTNINSFITVCRDTALEQAAEMDKLLEKGEYLGPLHGIPYGLKDIFDTKGIRTTWGAEPWSCNVPDTDSFVANKLRKAGAVLLGKTAVGALAFGDIWLGKKTNNPWNLKEGASGSSAGSAAAVAAGLCAFAIGTETLGSITSPSERCGVVGLRPTYGRISRVGCMALCWSLDKIGPITRFVSDGAIILNTLNGHDPADTGSIGANFGFDETQDLTGLKIGYLAKVYEDKATSELDLKILEIAKTLGLEIRPVSIPELPYQSLIATLYAEAAASFEKLTLDGSDDSLTRQDDGAWPNTFRKARFLSAVDHVQLDRLRTLVITAMNDLFNEVDFLIGPMAVGPMLISTNFSGHPCLQIPVGFEDIPTREELSLADGKLDLGNPEASEITHSVPRGLSIWSGLYNEPAMLKLGMLIEDKVRFNKFRPKNF